METILTNKIILDKNEHIVISLVADNPEQLYKHRNQVAAITNKRLLFIKFIGHNRSFENSYEILSIDIGHILRVRQASKFAIGGLLFGIASLLLGLYMAYAGVTLQLVGPGVIFIPILAIPFGIVLIFGVRRRVLIFNTAITHYKWVSGPLEFRKTESSAISVCEYFDVPREEDRSEKKSWISEEPRSVELVDGIQWYHYVITILIPYVGIFWGIVNLVRKKKRSGLLLLLGSIIVSILLNALIITISILQG